MNYQIVGKRKFIISNLVNSDIEVKKPCELIVVKKSNFYEITILSGNIQIDTINIDKQVVKLEYGSMLSLEEIQIIFYQNEFEVINGKIKTKFPKIAKPNSRLPKDYPEFHKAPRIMEYLPKKDIIIEMPPGEVQKNQENLFKIILPPLVMIFVSVLMMVIKPRGIYVIATLATTLLSLIFSVQAYFKGKKEYKKACIERKVNYEAYLDDKIKEITKLKQKEHRILNVQYPNLDKLAQIVFNYQSEIYMRGMDNSDFLTFKLGNGIVPTQFKIKSNQNKQSNPTDPLEKEAKKIISEGQNNKDIPVILNLQEGAIGYIGERRQVLEQVQIMLMRLATFHSYHEVELICLFREDEYELFHFLRWFPQILKDKYYNFVFNEKSRDLVLNNLLQTLKERETLQKEQSSKDELKFSPHYVLAITDLTYIRDHPIMEYLNKEDLGISLVYTEESVQKLPPVVKTVVEIRDSQKGRLISLNGQKVNQDFTLEHLDNIFNYELIPRYLSGLKHIQTMKSTIPKAITFLEMYNVKYLEELGIEERWSTNEPYKSLAVPLGVNGPTQDDIIKLNLHEKAHGPHGLVAGTTGSGKSEIIQSYILSLAVNFHPYDVAFLLIDYKGGGMANLFKDLPHLLGTITNLDASQSMRALISINAELKRRQRLFAENNVNHINQYQKLYNDGKVDIPMPHLFLISDEFAELKAEQPEFMDELISTARIGRSLGIHLILATQKPAGVVNDQIWSNSKFKLALKVADRSDSMEMLKTPDAAEITEPGRAYLQVGNNEVYELFQSAWSGADYRPDDESGEALVINKIDKLGISQTLIEDLSGLSEQDDIKAIPTELEAVIAHVKEINDKKQIKPLPRPWLPPLPEIISSEELWINDFHENWNQKAKDLEVKLGLLDVPSQQKQVPLSVNLSNSGNLAVFASPGNGKSTFLQTLVMELARKLTPEQVNFYLLDFGTNGLLPLKKLPHVADVIQSDEEEKINKFMNRINKEIKQRKKLLSTYSVANLAMYTEATGEVLPELIFVLDNYEGFKDLPYQDEFYKFLNQVARDGSSIGIHLALTAGSQGSIRTQLLNNIKEKIVLKQNNESEIRDLVGKSQFNIDDVPGRGLIRRDETLLFQTAQATKGETALEVIQKIEAEVEEMSETWQGRRPEVIPMMPEELMMDEFMEREDVKARITNGEIPLGLDYEEVSVQSLTDESNDLVLIGDKPQFLNSFFDFVLQSILQVTSPILLDTTKQYQKYENKVKTYVSGEDIKEFVIQLEEEINYRKETGNKDSQWLIIDDMEKFSTLTKIQADKFKSLYTEAKDVGIKILMVSNYTYASNYASIIKPIKGDIQNIGLVMRISDQAMFDKPYLKQEPILNIGDVYYYHQGIYKKIKYPN